MYKGLRERIACIAGVCEFASFPRQKSLLGTAAHGNSGMEARVYEETVQLSCAQIQMSIEALSFDLGVVARAKVAKE